MRFLRRFLQGFNRKQTRVHSYVPNEHLAVSAHLDQNYRIIHDLLSRTEDLHFRDIDYVGKTLRFIFLRTVCDVQRIEQELIYVLLYQKKNRQDKLPLEHHLVATQILKRDDLQLAVQDLLKGYCLILEEGSSVILSANMLKDIHRDVNEPINELVVKGSHEGFVESLNVNIHLLRRRIENPHLTVRYHQLGEHTQSNAAVLFLSDLANDDVVQEIEQRLKDISADILVDTGAVEEFIEDDPTSVFPQIMSTERPDRTVAQLMEGRVAILLEGSPLCLILPATFFAFYQTPDDYNSRWWIGTFYRMLRLASFIIAIGLPAFYIAVISYHSEIIPPRLVTQIKASIDDVPFPPLFEALLVELMLELIRESAVRMAKPIGQVIGIVGGLVIGEAIVRAGFVSNVMIIVVALTALSSFIVPDSQLGNSIRLLRFPMMIAAATLGFLGIVYFLMFLLIHLCKLTSVNTPYFYPFAPFRFKDIKDTIIRIPMWKMNLRPKDSSPKSLRSQQKSREWNNDQASKKTD